MTGCSSTGTARSCSSACLYCLGTHRGRGVYCSGSCRVAAHRAIHADELDRPSLRRDTCSSARRKATGYGLLTAREGWDADRRVRLVSMFAGAVAAGVALVSP